MHDPLTQAFQINIPLPWKVKGWFKNDPPRWATYHLATIWHKDPDIKGDDDSCGWFMRAHHGDPKVLEKIIKRFDDDWDRTWTYDPKEDTCGAEPGDEKRTYCRGLMSPSGMPRFSTTGVVLNLFFMAASEHFQCDGRSQWNKSKRFMRDNLFDLMLLSENTVDSMFDSLNCSFGKDSSREDRIRNAASVVYGWILRETRPWYKHPRWHIHHWRIQVIPWQLLRRFLFERCCYCKKRFRWNEAPISDWNGTRLWHDGCGSECSKLKSD